jgi:hypothetical protein
MPRHKKGDGIHSIEIRDLYFIEAGVMQPFFTACLRRSLEAFILSLPLPKACTGSSLKTA